VKPGGPLTTSPSPRRHRTTLAALLLLTLGGTPLLAQHQYDYHRPVEAAPSEADIGEGYVTPVVQYHPPRPQWHAALDVGLLAAALLIGVWLVLKRRSRAGLLALAGACLIYFGFYRQGCICPIGAIQNVAAALTDPDALISYYVIAIFLLPLIMAVLFGRVFCGGVCPLGAIQELVLLKPLRVPNWLDRPLRAVKWLYLLLAIWLATRSAATGADSDPTFTRDFIICRFDPFVPFFRFAGPTYMLLIGGGLLILALFVGRPYCRYLCPYGVLLSLLSRFSWRSVNITPDKELDCGLCADACPYGAIKNLRAERSTCLYCARCFNYCPRHRVRDRDPQPSTTTPSD
jgi:NAD-dependent dihydropyrimidine dehydrogenase PreA subunit